MERRQSNRWNLLIGNLSSDGMGCGGPGNEEVVFRRQVSASRRKIGPYPRPSDVQRRPDEERRQGRVWNLPRDAIYPVALDSK